MVTGDNDSTSSIPESLTERIPSRSALNQPPRDHNDPLDTTLPATEQTPQVAVQYLINRLADVLTKLKNRPTAQLLTIRPDNSNTLTFDGQIEKLHLVETLFHTMIKMQTEITEQMETNHFHSLFRKGALQTFKNISTANRQTLEDVLVIFRRTYVKPESQATVIHIWHRLLLDLITMKLPGFREDLNKGADKAFGDYAQKLMDSLPYAKRPPKLKR